jgi:TatA/E family protein of Tat protein translocase
MLDIGFQELLVLMVLALLVFGPDKLPDLGRRLGRALREFRRASDEFRSTIETNLQISEDSILPPSAAPTPSAEPAPADGLATAPVGGAATGVAGADGAGVTDVPKGLTPDLAAVEEPGAVGVGMWPSDPFCAQRGGRLLHRTACDWAGRIPDADRIALKSAAEGWEIGLKPCPRCDPQDPTS